jgi:excisionase family DNA binding protein
VAIEMGRQRESGKGGNGLKMETERFSQRVEKKKKWEGPRFMTVCELSEMLQVSEVWIYKLCDQGRIPFFRLAGKSIRFRGAEIDQWLQESKGAKYRRDKAPRDGPQNAGYPSEKGDTGRSPATQSGEQR